MLFAPACNLPIPVAINEARTARARRSIAPPADLIHDALAKDLSMTAFKKKDLRGGTPLWAHSPRITVRRRTQLHNETCDVAVVGAGVSGALIAVRLAQRGHDVVILDRREPCHGSTLASTAMIQFELDTPLFQLADKIGARRAERAYARSFKAVKQLGALIEEHALRCSWQPRDALYLAGDEHGSRALKTEAAYRARIGLPSVFLDAPALREAYGIARTGAVFSSGAAEVNPVQLAAGCLRAARAYGARLYSPCEVAHIETHARGVVLHMKDAAQLRAQRVVFATGYEVIEGLPRDKFEIISTWAIASAPIASDRLWKDRCLIWEASDPYLYLRATHDNRIVAGGEDSKLNDAERRDAAILNKAHRLRTKIEDLLPSIDLTIDYAWAGAFADSPTGLPHIAPLDDFPNCFAVLGCGGNGITFSVIAAEIATHWAEGRKDPDADLFN